MITADDLSVAIDELLPPNRPVMVHASLRSFGRPIAGGADTLLDALLARERTLLVPTFTERQFAVAAPATLRPARNGINYAALPAAPSEPRRPGYTTDCGLINPGLGVLPAVLLSRVGVVRSEHPLNSFAALGPLASRLIATQGGDDVYGPLRRLADYGGAVLLVGVGLNRMTALHLAEQRSGRRLFLRWAKDAHGKTSLFEVGSCSEGFPRLESTLRPYARSTTVGGSAWTAYPAKSAIEAATAAIAANQEITRCSQSDCLLCSDSIAGGPIDTLVPSSLT